MSTSIFKEEQNNIIKNLQTNKEIKKFVLLGLIGLLIIFGVAYITPAINQEENIKLFCIVFISALVLAAVDFVIILKFAEKERIVNILCIVMCFLAGILIKNCYVDGSIKNILICSSIILMYYTIVAIISLRKKKLFFFIIPLVLVILYLGYKYLNLNNGYVIAVILNTITLTFSFIVSVKSLTKKAKTEDVTLAKLIFLIIFIVENIFFSNII